MRHTIIFNWAQVFIYIKITAKFLEKIYLDEYPKFGLQMT